MSLPNPAYVEAFLNNYLSRLQASRDSTLSKARDIWHGAMDVVKSVVGSKQENSDEQKQLTEQEREKACEELKTNAKKAKNTNEWIAIIYTLGNLARKAQEGGHQYSRLCEALHAVRTYIIFCLTTKNENKVQLDTEIEKRSQEYKEASDKERTILLKGYIPNKSDYYPVPVNDILFALADLGHEPSILDARNKDLFRTLAFPSPSLAPTAPYIPEVSEKPEYNVHFPWCYQKHYFQLYMEKYKVDFNSTPAETKSVMHTITQSPLFLAAIPGRGTVTDGSDRTVLSQLRQQNQNSSQQPLSPNSSLLQRTVAFLNKPSPTDAAEQEVTEQKQEQKDNPNTATTLDSNSKETNDKNNKKNKDETEHKQDDSNDVTAQDANSEKTNDNNTDETKENKQEKTNTVTPSVSDNTATLLNSMSKKQRKKLEKLARQQHKELAATEANNNLSTSSLSQ